MEGGRESFHRSQLPPATSSGTDAISPKTTRIRRAVPQGFSHSVVCRRLEAHQIDIEIYQWCDSNGDAVVGLSAKKLNIWFFDILTGANLLHQSKTKTKGGR